VIDYEATAIAKALRASVAWLFGETNERQWPDRLAQFMADLFNSKRAMMMTEDIHRKA
jgi:hypothetical protein